MGQGTPDDRDRAGAIAIGNQVNVKNQLSFAGLVKGSLSIPLS
ncbi:hypothetical protein [Leptolyngbya sp. 'hensonii']|nr:hypothetical protein [Leptolyngbya sp. 'hensonii']